MLYTSYLSNLDKLPENSIKLIVTRYSPKDLNILKYNKLHVVSELSPSKELLNEYNNSEKSINDWNVFKEKFNVEIHNRSDIQYNICKIKKALSRGIDVCLICYEKNYNMCHRKLLAEYISQSSGYEWKEF